MDLEEQRFRDAERLLKQSGYTLTELLIASSRYKSTLLMMSDDDLVSYRMLYDCIAKGGLTKVEKGKKLEELSAILFQKSVDSLFDVYKNCRTSTNEIDLLIRWTEKARLSGLQAAFPFFGDSFLCECKNYGGAVKVTYVGKFSSLMLVTDSYLGIMISWEGVTGRGKWSDSQGLIKKIALREKRYIIVLDKYDLKKIYDKKESVFSIIYDKYTALRNETDYDQYIEKHEAEDCIV
ncbi:MAG: hypothetical protein K2K74_17855 [Lachnospiraceae bacterium]|nr:hypothetical protein [Lachnospiraceae bacterium]